MSEIRILTVRQPWAWAIIHGGKDVENRTRNIAGKYRGPIAIHAALADDLDAWQALCRTSLAAWSRAMDSRESLVNGSILGVADLVDVHPVESCIEQQRDGDWLVCSEWAERNGFHLTFTNPRPLAEPIPFKGGLGLRRFDSTLIEGAF